MVDGLSYTAHKPCSGTGTKYRCRRRPLCFEKVLMLTPGPPSSELQTQEAFSDRLRQAAVANRLFTMECSGGVRARDPHETLLVLARRVIVGAIIIIIVVRVRVILPRPPRASKKHVQQNPTGNWNGCTYRYSQDVTADSKVQTLKNPNPQTSKPYLGTGQAPKALGFLQSKAFVKKYTASEQDYLVNPRDLGVPCFRGSCSRSIEGHNPTPLPAQTLP